MIKSTIKNKENSILNIHKKTLTILSIERENSPKCLHTFKIPKTIELIRLISIYKVYIAKPKGKEQTKCELNIGRQPLI